LWGPGCRDGSARSHSRTPCIIVQLGRPACSRSSRGQHSAHSAQAANMASMDVDQDHPKKRLMIREMVLENFKSYAGAQHIGPFHKVGAAVQRTSPALAVQSSTSSCVLACSHAAIDLTSCRLVSMCSASLLWWAPMAAASPTSLMPCCLCLGGGPSRCAPQSTIHSTARAALLLAEEHLTSSPVQLCKLHVTCGPP
jgi:hypothetical protein